MKPYQALDLLALTACGLSLVVSSPVSYCPDDSDVCLRWAVAEAQNESDFGDIYLQIEAPTSYQWIGLGIGSQMAGAVMFLVYEDGQGNVTVSHREGRGHTMPLATEQESIVLLNGSGVEDGRMIANLLYTNPGDFGTSGSSDWIMAMKQGTPLDSTDPDESISQHDSYSDFSVDLAQALVASDVNPFAESNANGNGNGNPDDAAPGGVTKKDSSPNDNLILAHGVILTVVFVAIYPLGAILMRLFGKWYIHAGWQMIGFAAMWAGFGLGYVVSRRLEIFFGQAHTRMGVLILALLAVQTILGGLHHLQYRRQGKRGIFGHVHIWHGRATMILGVVNGGLGLQLTGGSKVYIVVYSVAASVFALLYAAHSVARASRRNRKAEVKA